MMSTIDPTNGENGHTSRTVDRLVDAARIQVDAVLDAGAPDHTVMAPIREGPGTRIGPYKLLQQIGEGGFGVVFMAEQEKPVVRRVALKVIKLGMDTRQVVARFEAERQALAMMDHPNIAKVHDAGATEVGRPYFVMELCTGDPITQYCDKENLTIAERLAIFVQVCQAVQHAHQKGIIHRDIKPSNVLVSTQDGRPHVKVIDFGIAKATGARLTEKTLFTEHKQLIGTPQYMSPEQAEGSIDIDTRTDVYSLGVLLYELLTGVTPFDARSLRGAAYAEIQRIIREVEPPKPSTRVESTSKNGERRVPIDEANRDDSGRQPLMSEPVSDNRSSAMAIARHRRTDGRSLVRALRGELDWIVMKCLEKDRARRYETVNGLALDVHRYVAGEPVIAAPPSRLYRVRKLVRRNRGPFVVGIIVIVVLLLGLAGTLWQAGEARHEARRAEERATAATKAEIEARAAEAGQRRLGDELRQVSEFQARMLNEIDIEAMGRGIKQSFREQVRHSLEREWVGGLPNRRRTREEVEAELSQFEERAGAANGADIARRVLDAYVLRRAGESIKQEFADQPQLQAHLLDTIGRIYQKLGQYEVAEPYLKSSLDLRSREHWDAAAGLNNLGSLLDAKGDYDSAEELYRKALAMDRKAHGDEHPHVATCLDNLACVLVAKRDYPVAEPLQREALALRRKLLGGEHPHVASSMNNLAVLLRARGDIAAAEPLFREALAMRRRLLGDQHQDVAESLSNLAGLLKNKRDYAASEALYREALSIKRRLLGTEHPSVATTLNNFAGLLQAKGDYAAAEPMFREALTINRNLLGDDHPHVASNIRNLASLLRDSGEFAAAEPLNREALANRRRTLGDTHPATFNALLELVSVQVELEHREDAMVLLQPALELARREWPTGHEITASILAQLARVYLDSGNPVDAEEYADESLSIRRAALSPGHWRIASSENLLGVCVAARGRFVEGETLMLSGFNGMKDQSEASTLRKRLAVEGFVRMYEAWDAAEPDKGYDAKAAQWRAELAKYTRPPQSERE